MALSGKVEVTSAMLEGSEGQSLRVAISMWSARMGGPVTYNQWQSAYFAILRDFQYVDDEATAGESSAARQKRMRAMWNHVQTELHGTDHAAKAYAAQPVVAGLGGNGEPEEQSEEEEGPAFDEADLEVENQGQVDGRDLIPYEQFDMGTCLLYTSPSPRDGLLSRMPSSA